MANEARYQEIAKHYEARQLRSNDSLAAAVCMRYLSMQFLAALQETLPSNHSEALTILESDIPDLDLLSYATTQWFQHLRRAGRPEQLLLNVADDFLDEKRPNLEVICRLFWFSGPESIESAICPGSFSATHVAAYFGLHDIIQHLLTRRDPSVLDSSGRSPLWWSATRCSESVTKLLVEAGVDPNVPDKYGTAPVHRAAANGDLVVFEHILSYKIRPNRPVVDAEGWTPLHWASSRGHLEIAKRIMKYRGRRDEYGTRSSLTLSGRTPLHVAALNGRTVLVNELSPFEKYISELDTQDSNGHTALHLAGANDHLDTVDYLLRKGSSTVIRDFSGKTPLDKAVERGNVTVQAVLLKHTNSTDVANAGESRVIATTKRLVRYGLEPFGNWSSRPTALDLGSDLNSLDTQDSSALFAIANGHFTSLEAMIYKSRRFDKRGERGRTLLHHVAAIGEARCAKAILKGLEERGSLDSTFLDLTDDRGWTALHYAVTEQFHKLVKLIVKAGASVSIRNDAGLTAYDIALSGNDRDILESLARYGGIEVSQLARDFGWNTAHRSAREGDLSVCNTEQSLLQELDAFGRLPIFRAAEMGHWEVVKRLADQVTLKPSEVVNLATAVAEEKENDGTLHCVLTKLQAVPAFAAEDGIQTLAENLLVTACRYNDTRSLNALLTAGVNINIRDIVENYLRPTALQVAINAGSTEAAIQLIESGADVSLLNSWGDTALHHACEKISPRIVASLLSHGANPNQRNVPQIGNAYGANWTPLWTILEKIRWVSSFENALEIVSLLLDHGADLMDTQVSFGESRAWMIIDLFHDTQKELQTPSSKALFCHLSSKGFDWIEKSLPRKDGFSPIHVAAREGDIEAVKRELDGGVPVDWQSFNYTWRRPLQIAVDEDNVEMAAFLLERGADVRDFSASSRKTWKTPVFPKSEAMEKLLRTACLDRGIDYS